jgi:hypothetical protein
MGKERGKAGAMARQRGRVKARGGRVIGAKSMMRELGLTTSVVVKA